MNLISNESIVIAFRFCCEKSTSLVLPMLESLAALLPIDAMHTLTNRRIMQEQHEKSECSMSCACVCISPTKSINIYLYYALETVECDRNTSEVQHYTRIFFLRFMHFSRHCCKRQRYTSVQIGLICQASREQFRILFRSTVVDNDNEIIIIMQNK